MKNLKGFFKKAYLVCFLIILTSIIFSSFARAIPNQFSVQGKLTDSEGNPIEGQTEIVFSIYTQASGGSNIWSKTHNMLISNGILNTFLVVTPNDLMDANGKLYNKYYLGIQVTGDSEMTPRQELASAPFAITAVSKGGDTMNNTLGVGIDITNPDYTSGNYGIVSHGKKYGVKGAYKVNPEIFGVLGYDPDPDFSRAGGDENLDLFGKDIVVRQETGLDPETLENLEFEKNRSFTGDPGLDQGLIENIPNFKTAAGVYGHNDQNTYGWLAVTWAGMSNYGAYGFSKYGVGVRGESEELDGVSGISNKGFGVRGASGNLSGVYGLGKMAGVYGEHTDYAIEGALGYYNPNITTSYFCTRTDWIDEPLKAGVYGKSGEDKAYAGYFKGNVMINGTLDATSLCPNLVDLIGERLGLQGYNSAPWGNDEDFVEWSDDLIEDKYCQVATQGELTYKLDPGIFIDPATGVSDPLSFYQQMGAISYLINPDPNKPASLIISGQPVQESANFTLAKGRMNTLVRGELPLRTEILENGFLKGSLLNASIMPDLSSQYASAAALNAKANATDVYTKSDMDLQLISKADANAVYTIVQTDNLLADQLNELKVVDGKANQNILDIADNTSIINANASALSSKANLSDMNSALALKADAAKLGILTVTVTSNSDNISANTSTLNTKADTANVYSKTEINNNLALKADTTYVDDNFATAAQGAKADAALQASSPLAATKLIFAGKSVFDINGRMESSRVILSDDQRFSDYIDYIDASRTGNTINLKTSAMINGALYPAKDGSPSLGLNTNRWSDIYAVSGRVSTGDLNEKYLVSGNPEDGSVMMITGKNTMAVCNQANSSKVSGIFKSKDEGLVMSDSLVNGKNIVLVGKYEVKVDATREAIEPGDLLVSSSVPGYATKAPADPKAGTIIGKALESLNSGTGKILVLVTLQ